MALVAIGNVRHALLSIRFVHHKCVKSYRMKVAAVLTDKPLGAEVSVQGWIRAKRKLKTMSFLDISDGSSPQHLQISVPANIDLHADVGASIKASGVVQEIGKQGKIELLASECVLVGACKQEDGYPFIPKRIHPLEHFRGHIHLRPRTNFFSSLLRIRSSSAKAFRDHFIDEGFFEISTPVLTSSDCEGAGEVFKVLPESETLIKQMINHNNSKDEAFFGRNTYLTVSGQMHLEAAARALGYVFSLGPTFRAENSKSRLHLSEFYMLEAEEVLEEESIEIVMGTVEKMLRKVTAHILNVNADNIEAIRRAQINLKSCEENFVEYPLDPVDPEVIHQIFLPEEPYTVMSYKEAIGILQKDESNFKVKPIYEDGLGKEHELFLVKYNGNKPVFITEWPSHLKAFYMKDQPDGKTVLAMDLLVPVVGELCGGSVRESCLNKLAEKEKQLHLMHKMDWYNDLRKFGNVSTGGFGMGFERYLQCILNVSNIKDVIPYPRWPYNCSM